MPPDAPGGGRQLSSGWAIPAGAAAGAGIGLLFGIVLQQLALGMILGAAIGLLAGASTTAATATPADRRGAVLALAIALVTAGIAIILLTVVR